MRSDDVNVADVAGLTPLDVQQYLTAKQWRRVSPDRLTDVAVYRPADGSAGDDVVVPQDVEFGDFAARLLDAVHAVADWERRPPAEVLRNLLTPVSDLLRFALADPKVVGGTVSVDQGVALFAGARKALLAAACTVIQPRRVHKRMTLADAEAFVAACRIGQTEVGSFVATLLCPIDAPVRQAVDGEPTAFARRVTATLMSSVQFLAEAIRADDPDRVLNSRPGQPTVSANLCESLSDIMLSIEGTSLALSASWAPTVASPAGVAARVRLPHEYVTTIERLAKSLRADPQPTPGSFVAVVEELRGEPGESGRREGEVLLNLFGEGDAIVRAKATLNPQQYDVAWRAHDPGRTTYVLADGILNRGRRSANLTGITRFELLVPPVTRPST